VISSVISGWYTPSTLADGAHHRRCPRHYPFADNATAAVAATRRLRLRITCWVEGADITVQ